MSGTCCILSVAQILLGYVSKLQVTGKDQSRRQVHHRLDPIFLATSFRSGVLTLGTYEVLLGSDSNITGAWSLPRDAAIICMMGS